MNPPIVGRLSLSLEFSSLVLVRTAPCNSCARQSGQGHSEAFGVITRVHFPDVELTRLAKARAPDSIEETLASIASSSAASTTALSTADSAHQANGLVLRTNGGVGREKEAAAADAELLDTLVGLVALRGMQQRAAV